MNGRAFALPFETLIEDVVSDFRAWLDVLGGIVIGLGLPAWLVSRYRRRRHRLALEKELRDAKCEQLVVLADLARHWLSHETEQPYESEWQYRDRLIGIRDRNLRARRRLWKALGYPESREDGGQTRALITALRELSTTQRWTPEVVEDRKRRVEEMHRIREEKGE